MKKNDGHFCTLVGDFLLCLLTATGVSANVFAGYEMTDPWHGNLLVVVASIFVMMLFLFFINTAKRWISFSATATLLLGEVLALQQAGAFFSPQDIDSSSLLFWIIVATASIVVFWATRTRMGIAILFLSFTYMSVAFDYLLYPMWVVGYGAALLGMAVIFSYRGQRGKTSAHLTRATAMALIAALIASGAYFGIIKPLVDPAKDMNLAQRPMVMAFLREAGISSKKVIMLEHEEEPQLPTEEPDPEESAGGIAGDEGGFVKAMDIVYKQHSTLFWLIVTSPILLILLAIPLKLIRRKRWYRARMGQTNEEAVTALYGGLMKKLKKADFKRPERQTLLEFANGSQEKMEGFTVYDIDFLKLTEIYVKMLYGYQKVSEEELECFEDFYKPLYKNLRREMGTLKYCLYFFSL